MNKETTEPNRYKELDALRGIAAIIVVLFHFVLCADKYDSIFMLGATGVDLFFIISGFVIFMSIEKVTSAKQFIVNRFSRLYPTYWAAVSFTFGLIILEYFFKSDAHAPDMIKYLANMTMFQYYMGVPDLDGPYWTMIIEMLFYITILILYKLNAIKYLTQLGLIISITTAVVCNYFYHLDSIKNVLYWFPLLQHLALFLAGILFYKIYTERTNLFYYYAGVLICLVCQMSLFAYAGRANYYISSLQYKIVLCSFFMLFVLFVHHKLKFIVNGFTLFLGKISFALYLIHQHISIILIIPILTLDYGMNFWAVALLIDLPIVIGIAALITYKIEIPLHKKWRGYLLS